MRIAASITLRDLDGTVQAYSECKVRAGSILTILMVGAKAAMPAHKTIITDVKQIIQGSSGLMP